MKTAVIYARYSSENQTEQSIDGQLRVCEEYAKSNDILILDKYIDRAMTGTNDNRPDFQRMIADSSKRQWNYVLVYKLDRFSRNKYETAKHKKTLKDNGVKLISAMEYIPDTPEAIIIESMLEGYAEYYSAELSQKVKRGLNESRLKGNFTGGFLLYGYKTENKKVVINEDEAKVVRYLYKQYSLGTYSKDMIKALTEHGIYIKGKPFTKSTIHRILKNSKYSGIYTYKEQTFDNIYPQIVPTELYEEVQRKLKTNHYGKNSVKIDYILKNKLICGYCGKPITSEAGTSHTGKVNHYYKCSGRKTGNGCQKSVIPKEEFENVIIKRLHEILNDEKTINTIIKNVLELQSQTNKEQSAISNLLREKKKAENSLNNILIAIENGIMNNTTNKRMKELESQVEDLERQIVIEKNKNANILTAEQIKEYYLSALKLNNKMLINYMIKQIIVYDDKIEIQFNNPIRKSPDSSDTKQGFYFYNKTISIKIQTLKQLELYVRI